MTASFILPTQPYSPESLIVEFLSVTPRFGSNDQLESGCFNKSCLTRYLKKSPVCYNWLNLFLKYVTSILSQSHSPLVLIFSRLSDTVTLGWVGLHGIRRDSPCRCSYLGNKYLSSILSITRIVSPVSIIFVDKCDFIRFSLSTNCKRKRIG